MSIYDDAAAIRDRLISHGVRATTDPRRITPPCVLVFPDYGEFSTMCTGDADTEWSLTALSSANSGEDTFKTLSNLVAAVLAAYPEARDIRATSYSTDSQGGDWPAYRLTLRTVSSWA